MKRPSGSPVNWLLSRYLENKMPNKVLKPTMHLYTKTYQNSRKRDNNISFLQNTKHCIHFKANFNNGYQHSTTAMMCAYLPTVKQY